MLMNTQEKNLSQDNKNKAAYTAPALVVYGPLADLTQGPSGTVTDGGSGGKRK